jgi:hypothetical protein
MVLLPPWVPDLGSLAHATVLGDDRPIVAYYHYAELYMT